jgi:hypothetical protein
MMSTNKQLKEAYKQKQFRLGVFQVRNTLNGKIFVGSSVNLDAIWNRISAELKLGGHRNKMLQEEWQEFGAGHFVYEIISELQQKEEGNVDYAEEVKKLEAMFIEELQPFAEKGYNARKV